MALSMDLRSRLLAAVERGLSCRAAADRFGVAPSTAIRWRAQQLETGDFAPKPQGGDMRSRRVEERAADILAIWEAHKDITLGELRLTLAEQGFVVSVARVHRFFVRRGLTRKKDRPCNRAGSARHPEAAPEPERLVFFDETWTATNMTRSHGRCPKGERLRMGFPHGH